MREPNFFRAKGDGIGIQMAEWPGGGGMVFCVHGLTANCRFFDLLAAGISPPHRVLAMDLRGRGLSDKPESGYSIEHHCRDIEAVAADLGLTKYTMLGHSLGAYISLAFAARRPDLVERLILVDGGAHLTLEQWTKVSTGLKPLHDRLTQTFPTFDALIDSVKHAPFMHPWNAASEVYFRHDSHEVDGVYRSRINARNIDEERGNVLTLNLDQYYPLIKCPVLVIRATEGMTTGDDLVLPAAAVPQFQRDLPGMKLFNLNGSNHFSMLMQPFPARDRAILDFLAG